MQSLVTDLRAAEAKIILYLGSSFSIFEGIFRIAKVEGLTGAGYVWITNDAIKSSQLSSPDYAGVIATQPSSFNSSVSNTFDFYWRDNRNTVGSPVANLASPYVSGKMFSNNTYYTATCVDLLAYGFDKFIKNATAGRNINGLVNGLLILISR